MLHIYLRMSNALNDGVCVYVAEPEQHSYINTCHKGIALCNTYFSFFFLYEMLQVAKQ